MPAGRRPKQAREAALLLKQTANPIRILILVSLADGEKQVGAFYDALNASPSSVSQHLARLRRTGLVASRREGLSVIHRLTGAGDELVQAIRALVTCVPVKALGRCPFREPPDR
jgi:DNA-binding transcriptional ArsR family regulator